MVRGIGVCAGLLIMVLVAACGDGDANTTAPASTVGDPDRGRQIWDDGGGVLSAPCSACHTLDGSEKVGPARGPDVAGHLRARRRPRTRAVRRRVSPGVDPRPGRIHRGGLPRGFHGEGLQIPIERRGHRRPGCLPPHAVELEETDPSSVATSWGSVRAQDAKGSMARTRPSPIERTSQGGYRTHT